MHKIGDPAEEALHAECDSAFTVLDTLNGVHLWLLKTAIVTTDGTERTVIDALAEQCEAQVNAARTAWLTARRAWADAAGVDLESIDGV
ncbi:hypothetical protein FDG2_6311 [Candidatus Protofrankia californiensis]|uniref:Uncharacterized protein n=1 Tax=Candidatus Protofrankia californiensis TaxID=1839754 RepID=A0A1C3PGQ8_9ACTN|nr:hypothetical protein FDG2_6311 [Candidatus Protofrankia californiensis]